MRKLLIIALISVVSFFLGWLIIQKVGNSEYTIRVTTNPGATISIATNRADDFSNIGTEYAEYTSDLSNPVFVKASIGSSESIATIVPTGEKNIDIFIDTNPVAEKQEVFGKPIVTPFWEKDVVHGVDERSHSLTSVSESRFVVPELSFISIPYVKNVVWNNVNNYAYNVFSGGAGMVVSSMNAGVGYFEDALSSSPEPSIPLQVAKDLESPLVLLSSEGIYLSDNFDRQLKKVASVPFSDFYHFSVDENHIYFAKLPVIDDEYAVKDQGNTPPVAVPDGGSMLYVYRYNGDKLFEVELPDTHMISGISTYKDGFVIATDHSIIKLDSSGNTVDELELFVSPEDISVVSEQIFVFSNDGVWAVEDEFRTTYLYHDISGLYVKDSLHMSPTQGGVLLFTTVDRNQYTGSVYKFMP